ncbi:hypothetical protein GALLN_00029 [Gallionellaceae bacterium]|nr:hypothetical protein GALLN_00029 [Gallionellaceae bacterium]
MHSIPAKTIWCVCCWKKVLGCTFGAFLMLVVHPLSFAAAAEKMNFASPEAGVTALAEAVRLNNEPMLRAILGYQAGKLISSGDAVADERGRNGFLQAYDEASKIVRENDTRATLVVGKDEWPLPIPLVKSKLGWGFDTRQGEKEILGRRIGRNEMAAIQVCLAIVDAQRDYAAQCIDTKGVPEYAPRLVSTAGKRDGLYWETKSDERLSPLGPLLATAASEGYVGAGSKPLAPYHGYYYRMLTSQGKDAPGGAHDYIVKGRMIGGFAVIAYPARYGASGVMSFMVNQDGVVHEKNLGKNTATIASKMTTYNPDASWQRVEPETTAEGINAQDFTSH